MEILAGAASMIEKGIAPIVVIALVLIAVISIQLRDLTKEQLETNALLRVLGEKLEAHNAHQTSRMEEVRRFMVDWWERFAPKEERESVRRRRVEDAGERGIPTS